MEVVSLLVSLAVFLLLCPLEEVFESARGFRLKQHGNRRFLLLVLGGAALGLLLNNPLFVAVSAGVAYLYDRKCRELEKTKNRAVLDSQAEVALQMVASLYEATGDLIGSLEKAAECVDDPLRAELRRTVADYRSGRSVREALEGLAARVPSRDVRTFVEGMLEAERFGADAGAVISSIVQVIRDRMTLREDLKNEMRGQRLTVNILLMLLPLMLGMAFVMFPQSKDILTGTLVGKVIVAAILPAEYFVWSMSAKGVAEEW